MKNLLHVSAVAACLLLAGLNTPAKAQEQPQPEPESQDSEFHDHEFKAGLACRSVVVQTKVASLTTTSPTFINLTTSEITIPGGMTGYLVATFSAESQCTGTFGAWCTVRISYLTFPPFEMHPAADTDFAFDAVDGSSNDLWEANSMQRISELLPAGTYMVHVNWAVVGSATFRLDDWLFKVEFCRA